MADEEYCVIRREDDSFAVEVTRSGALPQVAIGFATENDANAWIAQDRRLREAANPFRIPVHRTRQRF